MSGSYSLWHTWLEYDNKIIDAGTMINTERNPKLKTMTYERTSIPLYERCDLDTTEEDKTCKQNEALYKIYNDAPTKYWSLLRIADPEKYNILVEIYNRFSKEHKKERLSAKQKVNDKCICGSNNKFKKCCKPVYDEFMNIR